MAVMESENKGCHHEICWDCGQKVKDCPICREHIIKLHRPQPIQLTVVEIMSPTRLFVRKNEFYKTVQPFGKKSRLMKLSAEAETNYSPDWVKKYSHNKIWMIGDTEEGTYNLNQLVDTSVDLQKHFKYERNTELNYFLDFTDGLVKTLCCVGLMAEKYKFI